MRTTKTLKPGQKGTRELLQRFGPGLLCVRYRYDDDRRERLKTVELVVKRSSRDGEVESCGGQSVGTGEVVPRSLAPRRIAPGQAASASGRSGPRRVALRIGKRERDLQRRVKTAGGRWNPVR